MLPLSCRRYPRPRPRWGCTCPGVLGWTTRTGRRWRAPRQPPLTWSSFEGCQVLRLCCSRVFRWEGG